MKESELFKEGKNTRRVLDNLKDYNAKELGVSVRSKNYQSGGVWECDLKIQEIDRECDTMNI